MKLPFNRYSIIKFPAVNLQEHHFSAKRDCRHEIVYKHSSEPSFLCFNFIPCRYTKMAGAGIMLECLAGRTFLLMDLCNYGGNPIETSG